MNLGLIVLIVPLLVVMFAWTSVSTWISARAAERRLRERYALFRHLSERPSESAQLVLEQLRQDDLREEERRQSRARVTRRGKLEGALILLVLGLVLGVFLRMLVPAGPLWMIGLMLVAVGVVLAVSAMLELREGGR